MTPGNTIVFGIEVPSTDALFLTVVVLHVLLGLTCVVAGAIAMLSPKQPGRHPTFGTIYYWCLAAVFATATALSAVRWADDYHLFVLGALSFTAVSLGRMARRRRWPSWLPMHIIGMALSYILLLTAFYVDNAKSLPLWRDLPPWALWVLPAAMGMPILIHALLRHPLMRQASSH